MSIFITVTNLSRRNPDIYKKIVVNAEKILAVEELSNEPGVLIVVKDTGYADAKTPLWIFAKESFDELVEKIKKTHCYHPFVSLNRNYTVRKISFSVKILLSTRDIAMVLELKNSGSLVLLEASRYVREAIGENIFVAESVAEINEKISGELG